MRFVLEVFSTYADIPMHAKPVLSGTPCIYHFLSVHSVSNNTKFSTSTLILATSVGWDYVHCCAKIKFIFSTRLHNRFVHKSTPKLTLWSTTWRDTPWTLNTRVSMLRTLTLLEVLNLWMIFRVGYVFCSGGSSSWSTVMQTFLAMLVEGLCNNAYFWQPY